MRIARSRQLAFVEDFALGLGDGLSPVQICQSLRLHAAAQKLRPEQQLASELGEALQRGEALIEVFKPYVGDDLALLVDVGQRSGKLESLLKQHRQAEQQRQSAKQQFIRPLLYPLAMLFIAMAAVYFIGQNVLPKLAVNLPLMNWPALAIALSQLSSPILLTFLLLVLLLITVLVWGIPTVVVQRHGALRWAAQHGAFQIQRYFQGVWLLQTLTVLLAAKMNLNRALSLIALNASPSIRWSCECIIQRLHAGERSLAELFDIGLLAPRMLFRLSNGSRLQQEHKTLARVAAHAANDAVTSLQRLRVLLQSLCYLLIFVLLGVALGGMGSMLMVITQQTML